VGQKNAGKCKTAAILETGSTAIQSDRKASRPSDVADRWWHPAAGDRGGARLLRENLAKLFQG
jgi:hypothetical protein